MTRLQKAARKQEIVSIIKRSYGLDLTNCLPIDVDLLVGRVGGFASYAGRLIKEYKSL